MGRRGLNFWCGGLWAIGFVMLMGCGGQSTSSSSTGTQNVTIRFRAQASQVVVSCNQTILNMGLTQASAQMQDLRFYVSELRLVNASGQETPVDLGANDAWHITSGVDRVALIDLEDGTGACAGGTTATQDRVVGTVPTASYVGVRLTVGVPFALNHSDYSLASPPLDLQAMAWSWQAGRKFAKIELAPASGQTWTGGIFNVHLGSTGCTGNPAAGQTVSCTTPNRMAVDLPSFDSTTQLIAVDLAALVAGNDITLNQGGPSGCMSSTTDPDCVQIFNALALNLGSGMPLSGGAGQTLFRTVSP
jgi:uncharacterized repeat protein (TIGR04052 family)